MNIIELLPTLGAIVLVFTLSFMLGYYYGIKEGMKALEVEEK